MLTQDDYALFFQNDRLLTKRDQKDFILPLSAIVTDPNLHFHEEDYFLFGAHEGKRVFALSMQRPVCEKTYAYIPMRDAIHMSDAVTTQLICRGKHLLHWHQTSLFSGCCGVKTKLSDVEIAKVCSCCHKVIYPHTFPVIIVLIEKDKQILLARSPHFEPGMYSTLAGFVDPGESLEAALHREVEEEVGIHIKDIRYFNSQAWPFHTSLMIGFTAQYAGGDIRFDGKEIEDAKWFDKAALPSLPHECSIARHLIESRR